MPPSDPPILSQTHIMECMKVLRYAVDTRGICFGFTRMFLQAGLLGQPGLDTFHRRMNWLYKQSPDQLRLAVASAREEIKQGKNFEELSPEEQYALEADPFFQGI